MSTVTLPQLSTATNVGWPSGTGSEYYDEEAERVSLLIDEGIKQEAQRRKETRKREVRVLLLGQAESGKSTLHKQFQLFYTSHTLERERPSWRAVVYLNIIRAVRTIVNGLEFEVAQSIDGPPDPDFPITKGIRDEIAAMITELKPLLEAEPALSSEMNGGLCGRASAYARSEDILNVRIQTLGVVEHALSVKQAGKDYTWRMYDVGGA
ncbi:hypothetical protein DXG03_007379, partial [Asterophora parasitica]